MGTRVAAAITSRVGAILVLLIAAGLSALAFVTSPEQPAAEATDAKLAGVAVATERFAATLRE